MTSCAHGHASAPAAAIEHPVVGSIEPGGAWRWGHVGEVPR